MRFSIPMKFIAIALCALALTTGFASVLGIVQVAELGLYTDGFDGWMTNRLEREAYSLAEDLTERYAVRKLSNCPDEALEELGYWYVFEESIHWTGWEESNYDFSIFDENGGQLAAARRIPKDKETVTYQSVCSVQFPVVVTSQEVIDEQYGKDFDYKKTIDMGTYGNKPVTIRYYESGDYTVTVTIDADAAMYRAGTSLELVQLIYQQRYNLMVLLVLSALVLAVGMVYLGCAAGKRKVGDLAVPAALNRIPLDVYAAVGGVAGYYLGVLVKELVNHWIYRMNNLNPGTVALVGSVLVCIALLCIGFYVALCAQIKAKDRFWWHHSFTGWLCKKLWAGLRWLGRWISRLADTLPVVWQYAVLGGVMGLLVTITALLVPAWGVIPLVAAILLFGGAVIYGGYAYGIILRGAARMAAGDLDDKIDTRFLVGAYGRCAERLNALADVAVVAARKQMQADRMKTELITNVSHDIKTPLTSIINYVDILQSAKNAEESAQYLEVLGRQSQRLKKLIDDLVEMSKATTGNMKVDIIAMDPVETVNQALGEFADKLAAKDLTVIYEPPTQPLTMVADGRLSWRVLSNLLSNIVKYAMPGTRVYIDVLQVDKHVVISLKNISAEPLNLSAEELTERFVRGDTARNTEGSGLGLNIAKSLMELQKGQMQLLVDGDLFKVTLVFAAA